MDDRPTDQERKRQNQRKLMWQNVNNNEARCGVFRCLLFCSLGFFNSRLDIFQNKTKKKKKNPSSITISQQQH